MKASRFFQLSLKLIAGLAGISIAVSNAQTLTTLHTFSALSTNSLNSDGSDAVSSLVLSGGLLYGVAQYGGTSGRGTVFKVGTNGTGFTTLHDFAGADGANPYGELTLSGNTLYGTTRSGGTQNGGSVFRINTDGSAFTNLYSFTTLAPPFGTNTDGFSPYAGVVISGNTLFGTTGFGGITNRGVIYRVNTDGTGFTNLHNFTVNGGGVFPQASLVLSGSTLYGATAGGGPDGSGLLFSINTSGGSFSVIHNFDNNNEGASPITAMIFANGKLYGTASAGGHSGKGTIFAVNPDGSQFTNIFNFSGGTNGDTPSGGLAFTGNTLYGSTILGGTSSNGIIFSIQTNGTSFSNLYTFSALTNNTNLDGAQPLKSLVLASNLAFGTTSVGGAFGSGTLFQVTLPPQIQTNGHPAFFSGETALNGGQYYYLTFPNGNIFGFYNYQYFPYIYHYSMGFEYFLDANDNAHGAYLYDFTSGHFWYTSPTYGFPYVYDFSLNTVLYYYPDPNNVGQYSNNPRYFYNFATGQIIQQ